MPISFTTLTKPREVKIPFGDEELTLTYRPDAINEEMEERELASDGRQIRMLSESLAALIVSWNVEDKGKPVKPTRENIARLGLPTMRMIRDAITRDWLPN